MCWGFYRTSFVARVRKFFYLEKYSRTTEKFMIKLILESQAQKLGEEHN